MKQEFDAKLIARGPKGAWTHMIVPFDVDRVFGSKARVPVHGTINGFAFRTSIMPEGDGSHYMAVTKEMQKAAKAVAGETDHIVMEVDTAERTIALPNDLQAALEAAALDDRFAALAYSHRKEFITWIEAAKKPETRTRRVAKAIEMVAAKQHPKP